MKGPTLKQLGYSDREIRFIKFLEFIDTTLFISPIGGTKG